MAKRNSKCIDCGKRCHGYSTRCRSCSNKHNAKTRDNSYLMGETNPNWKGGEKTNICSDCGLQISRNAKKCKSCSMKGTYRFKHKQKGKSHWNWKGGITSHDKLERLRFRKTCHKAVLERDNFTCQECGQINGKLQVDHILSWSEYPELRFNLDNCRTLCMSCHYHETFGRELPEDVTAWGHNLSQRGG